MIRTDNVEEARLGQTATQEPSTMESCLWHFVLWSQMVSAYRKVTVGLEVFLSKGQFSRGQCTVLEDGHTKVAMWTCVQERKMLLCAANTWTSSPGHVY